MAENRISTPSSSTGIMRFYDVKSSNVQIDPKLVVGAAGAFVALEILLHLFM